MGRILDLDEPFVVRARCIMWRPIRSGSGRHAQPRPLRTGRWALTVCVGAALALVGCGVNASFHLSSHGSNKFRAGGDPREARYLAEACEGVELAPERRELTIAALEEHLRERGVTFRMRMERPDLHLYDIEVDGQTLQLRVATLDSARAAGRHLHLALLEHGMGYWGVHRSNLAILGPPGAVEDVLALGLETGLACFGVMTLAGRDDTFAVPGAYFEF
jgi:hypothetical protein